MINASDRGLPNGETGALLVIRLIGAKLGGLDRDPVEMVFSILAGLMCRLLDDRLEGKVRGTTSSPRLAVRSACKLVALGDRLRFGDSVLATLPPA